MKKIIMPHNIEYSINFSKNKLEFILCFVLEEKKKYLFYLSSKKLFVIIKAFNYI